MQWLKKHRKTTWTTAGVLVLLLVIWIGSLGGDSRLAKVQELRAQLTGEQGKKLTPEQRRAGWKDFGEQMKQLSPQQRQELSKDRERAFENKMKKFFSLPKKEQIAQLDQDINRQEAARQKWDGRKNGPGKGPGGKGFGKGPSSGTPQDREHRRKERLEQSTPEQRAMFSEYFRLLNDRRKQRGCPSR